MSLNLEEIKRNATTNASNKAAVNDFIEYLVSALNTLDTVNVPGSISISNFIEKNKENIDSLAEKEGIIFEKLSKLTRCIMHMHRINNFKLSSYINGILGVLEKENARARYVLMVAPLARAIYEIIAIEFHIVAGLEKKWTITKNQKTLEAVIKHLDGQVNIIEKSYHKTHVNDGVRASWKEA